MSNLGSAESAGGTLGVAPRRGWRPASGPAASKSVFGSLSCQGLEIVSAYVPCSLDEPGPRLVGFPPLKGVQATPQLKVNDHRLIQVESLAVHAEYPGELLRMHHFRMVLLLRG